jgi:hypothetical protein
LIETGQELMGTLCHAYKNKSNAHSTPRVMVWSRNNFQQTKYISKVLTCGIAYLVKKGEPNEKMRMRGKHTNKDKVYT